MLTTQIVFAQSIILIAMGAWGYFSSESPSVTALIPVFIGLIVAGFGLKVADNKTIAYILIGIGILTVVALAMPLRGSIDRGNMMAVVRISIMILATGTSIFFLFKNLKFYE